MTTDPERSGRMGPPEPAPAPKVEHVAPAFHTDAPPPVTDLSPALDEVEEIEEIEHLEEVEPPTPPIDAISTETPASLRILSHAAAQPSDDAPVPALAEPEDMSPAATEASPAEAPPEEPAAPEPAVAWHAVEEPPRAPHETFAVPPVAGSSPGDAELRDLFAGRAEEIFRTVASEAVEKVMWEMTDRFASEFSAKLREAVESVAWEVIPPTAEALIREEIARIRQRAGKPSP